METTQQTTGLTTDHFASTFEDLNVSLAPSSLPPSGASEIRCFIDAQLAFIAAVSAGVIILVLLTSTIVLAYYISRMKNRHRTPRSPRSNVDLVSGTGYWSTERRGGGIVGPCETSVLLEEVKTDGEEEEIQDGDAGPSQYTSTTNSAQNSDRVSTTIQSSTSRDSCIDPINVENIPLVV